MLFDPDRHESLTTAGWDADKAHAAIRDIVADAEDALGSRITWPRHPLDMASTPRPPHKSLYMGASGNLWALWYLQQQGAVSLRIDPPALMQAVHQEYLSDPDTSEVVPSYFLGEVGILLVLWRLTGLHDAADRLHAAIRNNIPNPTNEALWAAPGTMVGALHMLGWTGDPRWRELYLENVEHLWQTWHADDAAHCHLWTQDLYGKVLQYLGAGHGFAGNAYALLRGADLLPADRRQALYDRCEETLRATVKREGDCANWPHKTQSLGQDEPKMLVQWCHGAPGIVTGLQHFPAGRSEAMDEMLSMAGETVWKAGPLVKGPGLCHGTAGNGYAFLELHQRTGDPEWLARARSFAMHAIGQRDGARRKYGCGRYSLWTGDPGLAVYLWHCIQGKGGMPGLDVLD